MDRMSAERYALVLAGLGFAAKNLIFVLAPRHDSDIFLLPMFIAMVPLGGWLLLKGVDGGRSEARSAAS